MDTVQFYCKDRKKWQRRPWQRRPWQRRPWQRRPWQESDGFIMKKINRKAFTLIELLAVIVILALIMSIAVFSMSGILDSSKTNAKNRNIEGILDAVSKTYKTAMLSGTNLNLPIEATISSDGVITLTQNGNEVVVNYDGTYTNGSKSGTVNQDSEMMQYFNNTFYSTLDESIQEVIVNKDWDIGPISSGSTVVNAQSQAERDKWIGKIGLMNYMDWFNATTNSCQTQQPVMLDIIMEVVHILIYTCSLNNYLYKNYTQWMISPQVSGSCNVFNVTSTGGLNYNNVINGFGTRPSLYLTSNIQLSGDGTSTSPFTIS